MAGLNLSLGAGAQARAGGPTQGGASYPAATAGEAAFGPGFTATGAPDTKTALFPNDPFGVALWVGVGALGVLLFIRYSLPAWGGGKKDNQMLSDGRFWIGVLVGVGGVYAYHHWMRPLPAGKGAWTVIAGVLLLWVGYTAIWWGWRRVTQSDGDLLALIVPGRAFT